MNGLITTQMADNLYHERLQRAERRNAERRRIHDDSPPATAASNGHGGIHVLGTPSRWAPQDANLQARRCEEDALTG
jgi:hypothetical protein